MVVVIAVIAAECAAVLVTVEAIAVVIACLITESIAQRHGIHWTHGQVLDGVCQYGTLGVDKTADLGDLIQGVVLIADLDAIWIGDALQTVLASYV